MERDLYHPLSSRIHKGWILNGLTTPYRNAAGEAKLVSNVFGLGLLTSEGENARKQPQTENTFSGPSVVPVESFR